ncbi:MAG: VOC family protein [Oscillospiraceae bacterium]|nr:VOC family protein [Oscillospiraceae bacterium]
MITMPYLRFHGNCEEAFNFYAECFGSHSLNFSRLNNDPNNPIMHAHLMFDETSGIAGSDGDSPIPENFDILVIFQTREEVDAVFAKLSAGAKSTSDFKPHPPPDDKGGGSSVVDKYGYSWFLCV